MAPGVIGGGNRNLKIILAVGGLCQIAICQTSSPAHLPDQQPPSYEVATIKPSDGNGFALTLRMYIQAAFGIQPSSSQQLIGPGWIDKKSYDIDGKLSDSLRDAKSKMTREEKVAQTELMMQSLLADRFKLKYHTEMREMPVYKLVVAKGGLKLKEHSDSAKAGVWMWGGGQVSEMKGSSPIPGLAGLLTNAAEIEGRPVLDDTGLTGIYDFSLKWSSPEPAKSGDNAAITSDADAPSLFTAVQEQLGLRLVAAKAPMKVVIIDHIETPSAN
jgi:uncharacterized protein (TIGR03435 family)